MLLIALFAGLALLLAIVGLYGLVSYLLSRRTHEIGIRLALGASRLTITRLVLRSALWHAALGVAGGLLASIAVTGVIRSLLFEVEPTDAFVFGAVSALLLAVAVASMLPARRAARVHPIEVLRSSNRGCLRRQLAPTRRPGGRLALTKDGRRGGLSAGSDRRSVHCTAYSRCIKSLLFRS